MSQRKIHPDFLHYLKLKDQSLIDLYTSLRHLILSIHPEAHELLYHTHALTSVYSISTKLGDGYCHIPIYSQHLNLGFNKGTLLDDPHELLQGTGKLIRHIPIKTEKDFKNKKVKTMIKSAINFAISDTDKPIIGGGQTISKIKLKA